MPLPHFKKETAPVQKVPAQETAIEEPLQTATAIEKASKAILYFLVLVLPLFFWPGFSNVLDLPKQFLLAGLILVTAFLWLLDVLGKEKIDIRLNFVYLPIFVFLIVWGVSTLFSFSRYGSFWGWPLRVNEGFVTLFAFVVLFFLIHQLVRDRKELILFLILLVSSGLLVSFFGFLQIWGKFLLPFDFSKSVVFNTIGSPSALAVFAAALLPLTLGLISATPSWWRIFFSLAAISMLTAIIAVNAWFAWVVLFVSSAVYLALLTTKHGLFFQPAKLRFTLLPVLLVAVSLIFLLNREPLPGIPTASPEVYPSYRTSLEVNLKALKERPILGTGPGTFIFNYSKFKDPAINQTIFWNTRFVAGGFRVVDILGTGGALGAGASLLLIIAVIFYLIWQKIGFRETAGYLDVALVSSLVGVMTGQFVSSSSLSLDFLFWVFLGLVLVHGSLLETRSPSRMKILGWSKTISTSLTPANNLVSLAVSFAMVGLLTLGIGFFYFGAKMAAAEVFHFQGLRAFQEGDAQNSLEKLARAAKLNPHQDVYFRDLAQLYLNLARQESLRQDITPEQIQENTLRFTDLAIKSAIRASELEPKNVANWLVRGFIYRNLIGVAGGAEEAVLNSGYERAIELEPANPFLITEIGRVYIQKAAIAQLAQKNQELQDNLAKAEEQFKKALELKPNYAPAYFQLATAAELRGDIKEVINKLRETKMYVDNVDDFVQISFQLGVLHYRNKEYDRAKSELEAAVNYNENFSDARYFLGLIYDAEGRRAEAIEQFERIEALNPDNELVKTILANLRQGRPALATKERPPQPPPFLEGQPEEIIEEPQE